jgi:hypothetical protein
VELEEVYGHRRPRTSKNWQVSVLALEKPTAEQMQQLDDGGYDFWNDHGEDNWHGLLEKADAKLYHGPEEVLTSSELLVFTMGVGGSI